MIAIVGLGNVGKNFEKTRHNAGFIFLDELCKELSFGNFIFEKKFNAEISKDNDVILVKPQTMMNLSGESVLEIVNFYKIDSYDLIVVHDDLDIFWGDFKLQYAKGPKIHNGILSIEEKIKNDFWRMRIGVDNRDPGNRISGEEYVLMPMLEDEIFDFKKIIKKATKNLIEEFNL